MGDVKAILSFWTLKGPAAAVENQSVAGNHLPEGAAAAPTYFAVYTKMAGSFPKDPELVFLSGDDV